MRLARVWSLRAYRECLTGSASLGLPGRRPLAVRDGRLGRGDEDGGGEGVEDGDELNEELRQLVGGGGDCQPDKEGGEVPD